VVVFPGAEGFGSDTVAGEGGRDLYVTNRNPEGDGSLRMAVNQNYPRKIHFKVAGDIVHTKPLNIEYPYFTIEAISAPGPVVLKGSDIRVHTHDGLFRHIRMRTGDTVPPHDGWDNRDVLKVGDPNKVGQVKKLFFDHCGFMFSVDELVNVWDGANEVGFMNCAFAWALRNSKHPEGAHSMGPLFGDGFKNVSLIKSIIACNVARNPQVVKSGLLDMYNCLVYNYGNVGTEFKGTGLKANMRNNVFKAGPDTTGSAVNITDDAIGNAEIYWDGNVGPGYTDAAQDSWGLIKDFRGNTVSQNGRRSTPHQGPAATILPTKDVLMYLLYNAGAKMPARDALDTRLLVDILYDTGKIIDSPSEVGG
jgi:hypothetical protein